jgi:UDP-N-acetylmuramyl pentapeptide phosphotransferase/UDP-N-acetylglucosamine-1-phosphate transferase
VTLLACIATACAAAILSAGLIRLLHPLLVRYALARPNARSSHIVPTPQGGGIAVLIATLVSAGVALVWWTGALGLIALAVPAGAALLLAVIGGVDDVRPLPALSRLLLQGLCVAALVVWSDPVRLLPDWVPFGAERALLIIAGIWWVNLVNFMDGIDWMTVAEGVPLAGALCLFGLWSDLPLPVTLTAAALLGGLVGFAPANRPVARLFLGDVGSLPIGLITGWLLLELARSGAIAAVILLPLYYLADATLTLLLRLRRGERVWEAHRSHFYQRARDHGFSVMAVDGRVFGLNVALIALSAATMRWPSPVVIAVCLALGCALVGWTLWDFAAPRRANRPTARSNAVARGGRRMEDSSEDG